MSRLSPAFVRQVCHSGKTRAAERHTDGYGLMLNVQVPRPGSRPGGAKSWVQQLRIGEGRRIVFGLGPYPVVSLKRARELALQNYAKARRGEDPRPKPARERRRERSSAPTFREAAASVIELQSGAWKNAGKSRQQWESSLAAYVFPVVGAKRVDEVTSADVMAIVEPIWTGKRETASRVRQRVSAVMKWAVAQGHRADDPAGAALLRALPRGTGAPKRHHQALPYDEVGDAVRRVRGSRAWLGTKLAFEFLVLTACRSGEVRGAVWSEVDAEHATWTIPAERMKAKAEHRVPLSDRCLEVLAQASELRDEHGMPAGGLVFPSVRGKALSDSTMSKLLRDLGVEAVPHGFRASFRDWAAERTDAPHAVMEAALAHVVPNAAERAYARSDLFERRRGLMEQWAAHVCGDSGGRPSSTEAKPEGM